MMDEARVWAASWSGPSPGPDSQDDSESEGQTGRRDIPGRKTDKCRPDASCIMEQRKQAWVWDNEPAEAGLVMKGLLN